MRPMEKRIVFSVEPADRGVGIMSEGFSAWEETGTCWCNLDDIGFTHIEPGKTVESPPRFTWFDIESGNECPAPNDHAIVEGALVGFANGFYENESDEPDESGSDNETPWGETNSAF
jgi:hypothetical protein